MEFDEFATVMSPIKWQNNKLYLLDQRLLPFKTDFIAYQNCLEIARAIQDMVVRGAPAIGITAAYAVALSVHNHFNPSSKKWLEKVLTECEFLVNSRPTAVNLQWAVDVMRTLLSSIEQHANPFQICLQKAIEIHQQDIAANKKMGQMGSQLIAEDLQQKGISCCSVLTHCNAGALATGGYGTALGVIRSAYKNGLIKHVFADETRPWMQGTRLTAWEMEQENIPCSISTEGAAAYRMQNSDAQDKTIQWIIVGADRVTANGDVANKIGTYNLAIIARHFDIKMMVVAPMSTIDFSLDSGSLIPIEQRNSDEVTSMMGKSIAPGNIIANNPAFDVTPAELISAIVTEKGIVIEPNAQKMQVLLTLKPQLNTDKANKILNIV